MAIDVSTVMLPPVTLELSLFVGGRRENEAAVGHVSW
jgi:hypothetical protein